MALDLAQKIGAILANQGPSVQGAVIVDMMAKYLAGHLPVEVRQQILDDMLSVCWKLVEVYHREFHEEPPGTDDTQH